MTVYIYIYIYILSDYGIGEILIFTKHHLSMPSKLKYICSITDIEHTLLTNIANYIIKYYQNSTSSERKYLSFYIVKYYIKLKRQTKLNKNVYKEEYSCHYFTLIYFYSKLCIGLFFLRLIIKQNHLKSIIPSNCFLNLFFIKTSIEIIHTI